MDRARTPRRGGATYVSGFFPGLVSVGAACRSGAAGHDETGNAARGGLATCAGGSAGDGLASLSTADGAHHLSALSIERAQGTAKVARRHHRRLRQCDRDGVLARPCDRGAHRRRCWHEDRTTEARGRTVRNEVIGTMASGRMVHRRNPCMPVGVSVRKVDLTRANGALLSRTPPPQKDPSESGITIGSCLLSSSVVTAASPWTGQPRRAHAARVATLRTRPSTRTASARRKGWQGEPPIGRSSARGGGGVLPPR